MNEYVKTIEAIREAYGQGGYTVARLIEALERDDVRDAALEKGGLHYCIDEDEKYPEISAALDDIYSAAWRWQTLVRDGSGWVCGIERSGLTVRAQLGALDRAIGLNPAAWPVWERTICAAINRDDYVPELEFALEGHEMDDGSIYAPIVTPWTGAEECYPVALEITPAGKITERSVEAAARSYIDYMRDSGKLAAAMQWVEAM